MLRTVDRTRSRIAVVATLAAVVATAVGCGSSSSGSAAPKASASASATASSSASATPTPSATGAGAPSSPGAGKAFYVSVGDSYAAGYQPAPDGKQGKTDTNGFAYQLANDATVHGKKLTLVNFGCGGATTVSLLNQKGCKPEALGPGGIAYPTQTQADAAAAFVLAHRADVGLITISIGGNDITSCARATDVAGCLTKALTTVKSNLSTFLLHLRAAAGPNIPIVGITYPDVILGLWVTNTPKGRSLATISVGAFKGIINPALDATYRAAGATFVDVTTAAGAYIPFNQTTTLSPYGTVPVAVAKTCELTYYCAFHDIHPRTNGYALIADQIRLKLPA